MLEPTRQTEGHQPEQDLGMRSAPLMNPHGKKRKKEESKEQLDGTEAH
jgi:hypothetical protein